MTYEAYEYCINSHIVPYFLKMKLDIQDVTYMHLQQYFNYKSINGKIHLSKADKKNKEFVGLSTGTLNKHKIVFMQAFKIAMCDKLIENNPVIYVKVPKTQKKDSGFYTFEQAETLIKNLNGEMLKPIVVMALYYDLRRSEVLGLKWDSIDFDSNSFRVEHTVVKSISNKNTGVYYKDSTKTQTSKTEFPLLPDVKTMLLDIKQKHEYNKEIYGNTYYESDYVFTWEDGNLIQPDYISKKFKKLLKQYGLPDIHFHNLRHSTASILIQKGFDIKSIQMWLRHADVRTILNIYAHVSENQKQEIANNISNLFSIEM